MAQLQSLVLTDRQGTPVNHTLLPVDKVVGGVGVVGLSDTSGVALTERRYSIGQRRSADRIRTTIRFAMPTVVTEVINSVSSPKIARVAYVDATFNFSREHTLAERNDMVGMFASSLATNKPLVHDTIVGNTGVY